MFLLDKRLLKAKFNEYINSIKFYNKKKIILKNLKNFPELNNKINELEANGIVFTKKLINERDLIEIKKEYEFHVSNDTVSERNQKHLYPENIKKCKYIFDYFFTNGKKFDLLAAAYLNTFNFEKTLGGKRIFPMNPKEFANYQWHHDGDFKTLKFFFLLTELKIDGQKMDYLPGTHKSFNSHHNKILDKNNILLNKKNKISLIGNPGDCYIFDGNGFHRGNRNNSYIRDIITIQYRVLY